MSHAPITTAIIASAGLGTRFLPVTKVIQKELLPILNTPIIEHVVADCVKAGITRIILVHSERNKQIKQLYSPDDEFVATLTSLGKRDKAIEVEQLNQRCEFVFVPQPASAGYGTAVPLKLVKDLVKNEEAFVVLMGDDFLYNNDGRSEISQMITTYRESGAQGLCTCVQMPDDKLSAYGVMKLLNQSAQSPYLWLEGIVEKPSLGTAPSNLVNVSKYIFSQRIFESLEQQVVDPRLNEWLITDTLSIFAQSQKVVIHQPTGQYLDGGNIAGWLKANITLAWREPLLRQTVIDTIRSLQLEQ